MQINFSLLICVSSVIVFTGGCSSCKDCPSALEYHLPISLTPQQDTFSIGDTLHLSIRIPKDLTDKQGGIKNTFENFDFKLKIVGYRYDEPHEFSTRIFNITTQIGYDSVSYYSFFDEYGLRPVYNGSEYIYEGTLTLKESGVFAVYPGTGYNDDTNRAEIHGECDMLTIYFYSDTNNGQNNNVELVSPYNGNSTFWENQFKLSGGYAFVVRE